MICIPNLALEIQDLSLPATVLLPRLDDRDMWQKHSEMLAPFTDLVGDCGETKTTKKNKTKK
jgi:hypothetical protein